jgi:hypothetical protein
MSLDNFDMVKIVLCRERQHFLIVSVQEMLVNATPRGHQGLHANF